jgi:hypothetical protein
LPLENTFTDVSSGCRRIPFTRNQSLKKTIPAGRSLEITAFFGGLWTLKENMDGDVTLITSTAFLRVKLILSPTKPTPDRKIKSKRKSGEIRICTDKKRTDPKWLPDTKFIGTSTCKVGHVVNVEYDRGTAT